MSSSATEGELGSIMKLLVEDTAKPSGQLELLQAAAKRIASALVAGCELSPLPLCCFQLTRDGGAGG